jgi:hypothetical protein
LSLWSQPLLKVLERLYSVTLAVLARDAVTAGFQGALVHCEGKVVQVKPSGPERVTVQILIDDSIDVRFELALSDYPGVMLTPNTGVRVVGLFRPTSAGIWLDDATLALSG